MVWQTRSPSVPEAPPTVESLQEDSVSYHSRSYSQICATQTFDRITLTLHAARNRTCSPAKSGNTIIKKVLCKFLLPLTLTHLHTLAYSTMIR